MFISAIIGILDPPASKKGKNPRNCEVQFFDPLKAISKKIMTRWD